MTCPRCKVALLQEDNLVYCGRCAYEPPAQAAVPVTPPKEEEREEVSTITSSKQLGRACVEGIREMAGRLAEIERERAELMDRVDREREHVIKEITRLAKVAEFCEYPVPDELRAHLKVRPGPKAKAPRVPRADGESRNSWVCPDCGHRTVSRWVRRHQEQECPQRKSA